MSVEVIFYETMSLEVDPPWSILWMGPPDASAAVRARDVFCLPCACGVRRFFSPSRRPAGRVTPCPARRAPRGTQRCPARRAPRARPVLTSVSTTGDEGSLEASPVAPTSGIPGGRQGAKLVDQDGKPPTTGEHQTGEPVEQEVAAGVQSIGEQQTGHSKGELWKLAGGKQLVEDLAIDNEGELSAGDESTDSDVVEVPIMKPELRRTGRARRPPERLSFHACLLPAAFTAVYDEVENDRLYDDAEEDEELPELDPNVQADPEHR
ncbi:unnamed protein product [Closterium sp. NIES-54]